MPAARLVGPDLCRFELPAVASYLRDHAIGGAPVLAAALGLELAIKAQRLFQESGGDTLTSPGCIGGLSWARAITATDGRIVTVTRTGDQFVLGDGDGPSMRGDWNCEAAAWPALASEAPDALHDNAAEIDVAAEYAALETANMTYGPSYRAVRLLHAAADWVEARLQLPEAADWCSGTILSPVLIDGALQAVLMGLRAHGRVSAAVPVSMDHVEWRRSMPDAVAVHAKVVAAAARGVFRADIVLSDLSGDPVALLSGVTLREVEPRALVRTTVPTEESSTLLAYHRMIWAPLGETTVHDAPVVVSMQRQGADWFDPLRGRLQPSLSPWSGEQAPAGGSKPSSSPWPIPLALRPRIISGLSPKPSRRLIGVGAKRLLLVAPADLWSEAAGGFLRSLLRERPAVEARLLLLDEPGQAGVAEAILEQARRDWSGEPEVRLTRSGDISQRIEKAVDGLADSGISLDGAWLVTGGLGKLGLLVTEHLAAKGVRDFLLLGRNANVEDPETSRRLAALRRGGISITTEAVDVSDEAAMARVLEAFRDDGHQLRGVVHCVGVTRDKLLLSKTKQDCIDVVRGKGRRRDRSRSADCCPAASGLRAVFQHHGRARQSRAERLRLCEPRSRLAGGTAGRTSHAGCAPWHQSVDQLAALGRGRHECGRGPVVLAD